MTIDYDNKIKTNEDVFQQCEIELLEKPEPKYIETLQLLKELTTAFSNKRTETFHQGGTDAEIIGNVNNIKLKDLVYIESTDNINR